MGKILYEGDAGSDNLSQLREIIEGLADSQQRVLHRMMVFLDNVRQRSISQQLSLYLCSVLCT